MKRTAGLFIFTLVFTLASGLCQAKVSIVQAGKLGGNELTPMGGERMGNSAGTIPEWTGGITEPPSGYEEGKHHIDPFEKERPLFTITALNCDKYSDKLSPGQLAMFKAYPKTFSMKIYRSHRTASYPKKVYESIKNNALKAEMTKNGTGIKNGTVTSPFPIPKNGLEIIWNHLLRYRGEGVFKMHSQAAVNKNGKFTLMKIKEQSIMFYGIESDEIARKRKRLEKGSVTARYSGLKASEDSLNLLAYFKQQCLSPARLAGVAYLIRETIDQVKTPRQAWVYDRGRRRVRRAPKLSFDAPGLATDGLRTVDDWDMFNGSPIKYEWTKIGKKELYIPYNSYKIHQKGIKPKKIIHKGHINPEMVRYELHRVWVVEGKLKKGEKHKYKRRVYYFDEDSWQIVIGNMYDKKDKIWRVSMGHLINLYQNPLVWTAVDVYYDLKSNRYLIAGMVNKEKRPADFKKKLKLKNFTPAALRRTSR